MSIKLSLPGRCHVFTRFFCLLLLIFSHQSIANSTPVAVDDTASGIKNNVIWIENPIGNDSDPDGDIIALNSIRKQPYHGTAEKHGSRLKYIPNTGFVGTDTFEYYVTDYIISGWATVTVDVKNGIPIAADDVAYTTKNQQVLIENAIDNDDDLDGDIIALNSIRKQPYNGTVGKYGNSLLYTPNTNFVGTDTFEYYVTDYTISGWATVTVHVSNTKPIANNDAATTIMDSQIWIYNPIGNDYDADGDTLTLHSVNSPAANGTASINGSHIIYQPNSGFIGTDYISYGVTDGTDISIGTIIVEVKLAIPQRISSAAMVDESGDFILSWHAGDDRLSYQITEQATNTSGLVTTELDNRFASSNAMDINGGRGFKYHVINKTSGIYSYDIKACLGTTCSAPLNIKVTVPGFVNAQWAATTASQGNNVNLRWFSNSTQCKILNDDNTEASTGLAGKGRVSFIKSNSGNSSKKVSCRGYVANASGQWQQQDVVKIATLAELTQLDLNASTQAAGYDWGVTFNQIFEDIRNNVKGNGLTINLTANATYCVNTPIHSGNFSGKSITINGNNATLKQCQLFTLDPNAALFEDRYLIEPLLKIKKADRVVINNLNGAFEPSNEWLAQWMASDNNRYTMENGVKKAGTCKFEDDYGSYNNGIEVTMPNQVKMRFTDCRDDGFIRLDEVIQTELHRLSISNFAKGIIMNKPGQYDIDDITFNGIMDELTNAFKLGTSYQLNGKAFTNVPISYLAFAKTTLANGSKLADSDYDIGENTILEKRTPFANPVDITAKLPDNKSILTHRYWDVIRNTDQPLADKECSPASSAYKDELIDNTRCLVSGHKNGAIEIVRNAWQSCGRADTVAPACLQRRISNVNASDSGAAIIAGYSHAGLWADNINCNLNGGMNWDSCVYLSQAINSKITDVDAMNVAQAVVKVRGTGNIVSDVVANNIRNAVKLESTPNSTCTVSDANIDDMFIAGVHTTNNRAFGMSVTRADYSPVRHISLRNMSFCADSPDALVTTAYDELYTPSNKQGEYGAKKCPEVKFNITEQADTAGNGVKGCNGLNLLRDWVNE